MVVQLWLVVIFCWLLEPDVALARKRCHVEGEESINVGIGSVITEQSCTLLLRRSCDCCPKNSSTGNDWAMDAGNRNSWYKNFSRSVRRCSCRLAWLCSKWIRLLLLWLLNFGILGPPWWRRVLWVVVSGGNASCSRCDNWTKSSYRRAIEYGWRATALMPTGTPLT